ncbi:hypothetical protein [Sporosarcina sp. ITBMC105]
MREEKNQEQQNRQKQNNRQTNQNRHRNNRTEFGEEFFGSIETQNDFNPTPQKQTKPKK